MEAKTYSVCRSAPECSELSHPPLLRRTSALVPIVFTEAGRLRALELELNPDGDFHYYFIWDQGGKIHIICDTSYASSNQCHRRCYSTTIQANIPEYE